MTLDFDNIVIKFPDGSVILGGEDEFFVEPDEQGSMMLDESRLMLIKRVQDAQDE